MTRAIRRGYSVQLKRELKSIRREMSMLRRYSKDYEQGRCPYGYEYVSGYTSHGVWHDSYCRKIRKVRFDPETRQKQKERQEEQEIRSRIYKQLMENKSPYTDIFEEEL